MIDTINPFTATPAEMLNAVAEMEPGTLAMSLLLMLDRENLDPADAVSFVAQSERVAAWWASVQNEVLVAAASPHPQIDEFTLLDARLPGHQESRPICIEDAVREEVAAAARWSPSTAQHRIDTARLLAGPLSATREALKLGEITAGHVAAIVESAGRLPGRADDGELFSGACAELQRRVLPVARRGTLSATRACARRAVLSIDAEGERRRRLEANRSRAVFVYDELDGQSTICARMATERAHAVFAAIDARAKERDPSDVIDARRVDAFVEMVLGWEASADDGAARRVMSAHVDVVIGLDSLLGLNAEPAAVRGVGAVHADAVRELLDDPSVASPFRRIVTDPMTGAAIDVGRTSYQIPGKLRRFIEIRDQFCRFPGCRRSASKCEVDHAEAWDDDGASDRANLGALCVRHHQLKTHSGWRIEQSDERGGCIWISPQGRRYLHEPVPPLDP